MSNLNDVLHIKNQTIKSKNKEINALRVKVKELTRALAEEVSPPPFGKSCCEDAALNAAEVDRLTRERDELQAKLDAAEWIGDLPNPGDIEVIKTQGYWAQGILVADADATPEQLRISNSVNDSISSAARREAVARFIDAEEAKRNAEDEQRIEEQAKALHGELHPFGPSWENTGDYAQRCYITAIRAGWTPPENKENEA